MHKLRALLAILVASLAIGVGTAMAILWGEPDNGRHPFVGLVSFHSAKGVPLWRCTGTLIDSDTLLTAAHCAGFNPEVGQTPARAVIWFDEGPIEITNGWTPGTSCKGFTGYPCTGDAAGKPIPHPAWTGYFTVPNTHDIGVVQLSKQVKDRGYGSLAPAGYVDKLTADGKKPNFTIVGYGLQMVKPVQEGLRQRLLAQVQLIEDTSANTRDYNVHFTNGPGNGTGPGGVCFGDSGGPLLSFDGKKEVIVGGNSFVANANCAGGAYAFRTDTEEARGFLASYTRLP
jgi:secreted trypsin-like serine protease